MKTSSLTQKVCSRRHLGVFVLLLQLLFLAGCNVANKKLVTYHVEFVADGIPYSVQTHFFWYSASDFERGTVTAIGLDNDRINGTLKDGTKFVVLAYKPFYNSYYFDHYKHSRNAVESRIYLRAAPNLVTSFDKTHTHSPTHDIRIKNSYVVVGNAQGAPYGTVRAMEHTDYTAARREKYYYTVGAKITPFQSTKQALDDYSNNGPIRYPAPPSYKKPTFNFHFYNATIENSEADIVYDGNAFRVTFPDSGLATTWVLVPDMRLVGGGAFRGSSPDVAVMFGNERTTIRDIQPSAVTDPTTGKAVIVYEDGAWLHF